MDKATEIADAIWKTCPEYGTFASLHRCLVGLEKTYDKENGLAAYTLQRMWYKKNTETRDKFKQEQLSPAIGYLVLLHAVHEFLEKEGMDNA